MDSGAGVGLMCAQLDAAQQADDAADWAAAHAQQAAVREEVGLPGLGLPKRIYSSR
jgi:hypothetical protein